MRLLTLFFTTILTLSVLGQEANPEAQRRGWNVPRSEREHYGFAKEHVEIQVQNHQEDGQVQRRPIGPRGPMMRGQGGPRRMTAMRGQMTCNCDCHKNTEKKGKKKFKNGEKRDGKPHGNKKD